MGQRRHGSICRRLPGLDADADTFTYSNTHRDADTYSNANTDAFANTDAHGNADTFTYANADTFADADVGSGDIHAANHTVRCAQSRHRHHRPDSLDRKSVD